MDEVTQIVRATVALVLAVRKEHGLPARSDEILRRWLLSRNIQISDQSTTLGFDLLERWLDDHESHLLQLLGADYSDQAVAYFEGNASGSAGAEATLARLSQVFDRLAETGQKERGVLWDQLVRLTAVRPQDAAEATWLHASRFSELADVPHQRAYLGAFAGRLKKNLEEEKDWPISSETGAERFVDLLSEWRSCIDKNTADGFKQLVSAWTLTQDNAPFAERALDVLKAEAKEAWLEMMKELIDAEWEERPVTMWAYLGRSVEELNPELKESLGSEMDVFISGGAPSEEDAASYESLALNIPNSSWVSEPFDSHLDQLISRITDMHSDHVFIQRLFPIAVQLFPSAADGKVGDMLKTLFANAAGVPASYIALHRIIAGKWPKVDENVGDFQPDAIVNRACQFIDEHSGTMGIADVFASLSQLVSRETATTEMRTRLAQVIPAAWKSEPTKLVAISQFIADIIQPASMSELLTDEQSETLTKETLEKLIKDVVAIYDIEQRDSTTKAVLSVPPVSLFERPDGALAIWLEAILPSDESTVARLLPDQELTDGQKLRIVSLASDHNLATTAAEAMAMVISDDANAKSRSSLLARLHDVVSSCESQSQRSRLAQKLIATLPTARGDDLHSIARSISELGGIGALERSSEVLSNLSDDQIDVLQGVFPSSRPIRGLKAAGSNSQGTD